MRLNPSLFIIVFSNVLCFMITEVVFFWEIASNNVQNTIVDKSTVLIQLAKQSPDLIFALNNFLNSTDYQAIQSQALIDSNKRYTYNIALIWNWMLPPFVVILSLLVICVLIEIIWIRRFDKTDAIILSTVVLCFSTEVIFYFTVIYRSQLISDMEVIQLLMGNDQIANYINQWKLGLGIE